MRAEFAHEQAQTYLRQRNRFAVLAGVLGLTTLVGFFIEPWIHGFRMAINPVIIFVSIFFWGWLWGPVGVLLAVPLMTVIQVVLKQIPKLRPVYKVIAR